MESGIVSIAEQWPIGYRTVVLSSGASSGPSFVLKGKKILLRSFETSETKHLRSLTTTFEHSTPVSLMSEVIRLGHVIWGIIFVVIFMHVLKIAKSDYWLRNVSSYWTDFHEIWYLNIFLKSVEKIQVSPKCDKNDGTLREVQYKFFFIISLSVIPKMRNLSDKICRENRNTHFVFNHFFFWENYSVCEKMWKNSVDPDSPQMTI